MTIDNESEVPTCMLHIHLVHDMKEQELISCTKVCIPDDKPVSTLEVNLGPIGRPCHMCILYSHPAKIRQLGGQLVKTLACCVGGPGSDP